MRGRFFDRDIRTAVAKGNDQFHLVVHVRGERRIGEILAGRQQVVGILLEKERRLALGVMSHLARMGRIVAADAIDAAHRKADGTPGNRQKHRR